MDNVERDYDINLSRHSDEDVDAYVYRMCRNKDFGLLDVTWEELKDILNKELGQDWGESKYRKDYQLMSKGVRFITNKNLTQEELIEEMRQATLELEMKRKKVQTESVYYNRILREHTREEMLFERVEDAISKAELTIPDFKPLQVQDNNTEWLLGFSDVHAYKHFESLTNKYNGEILEQRLNKLMGEVVKAIQINGIKKLTILNGGDNLEGMLRKSALQSLELGVVETVVKYQRWLLEWLSQLSRHVEIRYIHLISANHSETRPLNSRAGQFPKEDMEIIIANYIDDMCKDNPRIEVVVPEENFALFKMAGYNVIAHHGHGVSRNPRRYIERMSRKLRVFIDYGIFGHLHHSSVETLDEGLDNDCEIIRLPSIIGTDGFADSILEGAKASGLLLKFEEGKGRIQENKFILN